MSEPTPGEAAAAAAAEADAPKGKPTVATADAKAEPKAEPKGKGKAEPILLPDMTPKLHFLSAAEAEAQADALGGIVIHTGVAFSVAEKS